MHGIYNAVTEDTDFLYLFPADGYEKMRMEKLYGYYREKGYRHYAVNLPETACSEGQCANVLCCHFINDSDFSVLEYMLPQQMLFVLASRARGIDLNLPKDPEFHKYMGSKIE
jgi:glucosamine 6-phosphate synthetase-like amidotransferase/phosphosugar isomerase protein